MSTLSVRRASKKAEMIPSIRLPNPLAPACTYTYLCLEFAPGRSNTFKGSSALVLSL